jgi:hypothetical protein
VKMRFNCSLTVCLCAVLVLSGPVQAKRKDGVGGGPSGTTKPLLSFAADQSEYLPGDQARLSWASVETRFCTASGDWDGKFGTEGTWSSPPLDGPKTFGLKCTSKGGAVTATVQVSIASTEPEPAPEPLLVVEPEPLPVAEPEPLPVVEPEPTPTPPPTVSFSVADSQVISGATTTLSWSSTDADSCSGSGGWSGTKPTSGSASTAAIQANTTFSLSCSSSAGTAIQMVSVSVLGSISISWLAPIENVDGSVLTDLVGYRIYYGTQARNYADMIEVADPNATSHAFSAGSGDYFVTMTALDADSNESAFANEILRTVP